MMEKRLESETEVGDRCGVFIFKVFEVYLIVTTYVWYRKDSLFFFFWEFDESMF